MSKQTREAWTLAVKQRQMPQKSRSKYGAVKTMVDGIVFDSKREAQRYHELKLREKAGEVRNLKLQPKFPLYVGVMVDSEQFKTGGGLLGHYVADFVYEERYDVDQLQGTSAKWRCAVEDVKGFKTPIYRWKKRHVEIQYGIQIRET